MVKVSDLTYGTLKQYALDKLQDNPGEKTDRQAARCVRRALRHVSSAGNWRWLRHWHRLVLRERVTIGGTSLSVAVLGVSVQAPANYLDSAISQAARDGRQSGCKGWSFLFSGSAAQGTPLHRIVDYSSSTGSVPDRIVFHSVDQYVHGTTAARIGSLNGSLVKDRYLLPRRFKAIVGEPVEQDFFGTLTRISPEEMVYQKKTWSPQSSDPVFYCIQRREELQRKEVIFWPAPVSRESVDFLMSTFIEEPESDSDVIAWDPNHAEVIFAAIDRQVAIEQNDRADFSTWDKAFRRAVWDAKGADDDDTTVRIAGRGARAVPYEVAKVQRSRGFTDVD